MKDNATRKRQRKKMIWHVFVKEDKKQKRYKKTLISVEHKLLMNRARSRVQNGWSLKLASEATK